MKKTCLILIAAVMFCCSTPVLADDCLIEFWFTPIQLAVSKNFNDSEPLNLLKSVNHLAQTDSMALITLGIMTPQKYSLVTLVGGGTTKSECSFLQAAGYTNFKNPMSIIQLAGGTNNENSVSILQMAGYSNIKNHTSILQMAGFYNTGTKNSFFQAALGANIENTNTLLQFTGGVNYKNERSFLQTALAANIENESIIQMAGLANVGHRNKFNFLQLAGFYNEKGFVQIGGLNNEGNAQLGVVNNKAPFQIGLFNSSKDDGLQIGLFNVHENYNDSFQIGLLNYNKNSRFFKWMPFFNISK